ncbi:HAD family phosphatase [Pseudomonas sp. 21LCFQ02]|uniref:phosphatase n=1 Tax=unclassified Pseudomonas TaxID=196821 RepID=UPI0004F81407|nr:MULTISPECIES: phosphatase [unclassified Pseudomonas]MCO8167825.1 HAD family phosphatase [Pseudomonas sp. 21LCFQ02]MCQ9426603.1 HAD family phosphatase [Pseudomonas sp. LJDD11]BAP44478.1 phosphatase/phosphohexomutase-like protein [Pseudomonas sp. StFLB209]
MLAPVDTPMPAFSALLFGLSGCLVDFGGQAASKMDSQSEAALDSHAQLTPGALESLHSLRQQGIPCAWLDDLPDPLSLSLSSPLGDLICATPRSPVQWPAPDACWLALMTLKVSQLDGCVLVSGNPQLLQSGLNAGLWTIGLASCGSLCGLSAEQWQALDHDQRERQRAQATLHLYSLGAHSVIDHLGDLESCLADIVLRRSKGEKP